MTVLVLSNYIDMAKKSKKAKQTKKAVPRKNLNTFQAAFAEKVNPIKVAPEEMHRCMYELTRALANPFTAYKPCLGVYPNEVSTKVSAISRGTFTVGTNGIGYVVARPQLVTDYHAFCYTDSDYQGVSTDVLVSAGVAPGVNGQLANNSPFVSTDFSANLNKFRTITTGLRVRYVGPELYRQGMLYARVVRDSGTSMMGNVQYTLDAIRKDPLTLSSPVGKGWFTIMFPNTDDLSSHRTDADFPYSLVIYAESYVTTELGPIFEIQFVSHNEVVGNTQVTHSTANPSMPRPFVEKGFANVYSRTGATSAAKTVWDSASEVLHTAYDFASEVSYWNKLWKSLVDGYAQPEIFRSSSMLEF
jgi:hypothetical protein